MMQGGHKGDEQKALRMLLARLLLPAPESPLNLRLEL